MTRYKKYKNSSVTWLGKIPEHWEVRRLKNVITMHFGGCWGEEPKGNVNDVLCITVTDFNFDTLSIKPSAKTIRNYSDEQINKLHLEEGDIIFEKSGGGEKTTVGRLVVSNSPQKTVQMFANFLECLRPNREHVNPFYLGLCLKSFYKTGFIRAYFNQTIGIQNINISFYLNINIPMPPHPEQNKILQFIEIKSKKINKLISIKQHQISELEELKKAIIIKSVTKGLYDVPMKDSGVKWIGEIPEHWRIIRLKNSGSFENGLTYSLKDVTDNKGILVLRSSNVYMNKLKFSDCVFVKKVPEDLMIKRGDIIICSSNGSADLVGKCAYIDKNITATFGFFMMRYRFLVNFRFIQFNQQCLITEVFLLRLPLTN